MTEKFYETETNSFDTPIQHTGDINPAPRDEYHLYEFNTTIDNNLHDLKRYLPNELITPFCNRTIPERYEAMDTYNELNEILAEEHDKTYKELLEVLKQEPETEKLLNWNDNSISKTKQIKTLRNYLETSENIPENIRDTYKKYSNKSWKLAITNHRFLNKKIMRLRRHLETIIPNVDQEDFLQEYLITTYESALRYDSKIGPFLPYIDKFAHQRAFRQLLETSDLSINSWERYRKHMGQARKIIQIYCIEEQPHDQEILATALFFREKPDGDKFKIDFEDKDCNSILIELKKFLLVGEKELDTEIIKTQRNIRNPHLRRIMCKHLKKVRDVNNISQPLRLDLEQQVPFTDADGNIDYLESSLIDRIVDPEEKLEDSVFSKISREELQKYFETEIQKRQKISQSYGQHLEIVSKRYGLNGEKPKTLEELGKEHGVTKERVRQILAKEEREFRKKSFRRNSMEHGFRLHLEDTVYGY